jgi:hypothetical protein
MSTRVEAPPIGGSFAGPILIAIVVALVVGVLMGTVVTKVVNDPLTASSGVAPARPLVVGHGAPASATVGVGNGSKGIEGQRPAELFAALGSAIGWDAQKLEAMQGRVLAEQYRSQARAAAAKDAGKLEEMEGHQLAGQLRSEAMEDRQLAKTENSSRSPRP